MNNNDPIEIAVAINSPELIKQAVQVENALDGLDTSVSHTEAQFKKLSKEKLKATEISNKLEKAVKQETKTTTKQGNNIKTQKREFDGLGNSLKQITRELPAFTFSAQTGFMAISNNIPMLADEIGRLQEKNNALKSSGKKGVPVWKQVAKSFLSWNTMLSLGITLLTVYGKEIGNWINSLFNAEKRVDKFKETQLAFNSALKSSPVHKSVKNIETLSAKIKLAKKGLYDKNRALKEYNSTLGKTAGTANSLAQAEDWMIKNKSRYVNMMIYKSAASTMMEKAKDQLLKLKEIRKTNNDDNVSVLNRISGAFQSMLYQDANVGMQYQDKKGKENKRKKLYEAGVVLKGYRAIANKFIGQADKIATALNLTDGPGPNNNSINNRKQLLEKIAALDSEYSRKQLTKDEEELQALKDKFGKVRKLVEEFNSKNKVKIQLSGLNNLQKQAEKTLTYRQNTTKLTSQLDKEKELFSFYETFKNKTSKEAADKRYSSSLKGFKNYGELLQAEYKKLQGTLEGKKPNEVTGAEAERLTMLNEKISAYKVTKNNASDTQFTEAYNAAISHQEKLQTIERDFNNKKQQLSKITDATLKKEKQEILEQQKADAIDAANSEAYAKKAVFIQLSDDLVSLSKQELDNKIASIEEYLAKAGNTLSTAQKEQVNKQLKRAKSVQGGTSLQVKKNALLQHKEAILKRIATLQEKGAENVNKEQEALEGVNKSLSDIKAEQLNKVADKAGQIGSALKGLASDIAPFDEGLADSLETAGDLANVVGDAAGAAASFASGDIVGGITGAISAIGGLFSMSAKVRESERMAREELKKWQDEVHQAQLNYNAELRKRMSNEIKLNDIYKSRVANLREEITVNKQKQAEIVKEQQTTFNKLLKAKTVVGKKLYKTGGFLGLWKKTKTGDVNKSIAELLGVGRKAKAKWNKEMRSGRLNSIVNIKRVGNLNIEKDIKLTDELFENLEKINGKTPLTGDAKTAFEQIKKLRDEYGSITEANRQLDKQTKDAVTGTTAKTLADSIKEGVLSGKKTFADFADDIEGFLSQAIIAGMSAKVIEPQMQKLQDELYTYLGDGVLTDEEKQQFQEMYVKIADEAKQYMDLMNQSGITIGDTVGSANSLQGAIKGATADEINLLAGQFGGLRITQLDTNRILQNSHSKQLEKSSRSIELQVDIEKNTKRTAENTENLKSIDETLKKMSNSNQNNAKANGISIP